MNKERPTPTVDQMMKLEFAAGHHALLQEWKDACDFIYEYHSRPDYTNPSYIQEALETMETVHVAIFDLKTRWVQATQLIIEKDGK